MSWGAAGRGETELRRRADVGEDTLVAAWLVRDADPPAVEDETQAQRCPFAGRDDAAHVLLDLHRVGRSRQAELPGEARHVRVDGESRHRERDSEHHVGGLAAHATKLHQVLHPWRHLAVMKTNEVLAHLANRARFGAEEA